MGSMGAALALLVISSAVVSSSGARSSRVLRAHDALKLARCDAKCWSLRKPEKGECIGRCLQREKKPGECQAIEDLSVWDAACVTACSVDAECPGLLKCCLNRCGATCQQPKSLQKTPGLPSIPENVLVKEKRRGRKVRVVWSPAFNNKKSPLFYVLEERQHVGKHCVESKFDEWVPKKRSQKTNITIKHVKPGRWYQYRVAAVNENGTRGYSKPSAPFTRSHGPRSPGLPQNLTIDTLQYQNGTFSGILRWKAPLSSDLPIYKYKVFWSRRLQEVDQEQNSILVHHHSVNKDQTYFELKGLRPKSLYFLQVQALAQFGTMRLKSEKAAILVHTKKFSNESVISSEGNSSKRSAEFQIEDLQLKKIYLNKGQLLAKITWKPIYSKIAKNTRYSVQWWTGPCQGEDKGYKTRKQIAVTTDVPKMDLYDLDFGCKYTIYVNKIPEINKSSLRATMTIVTPSCIQLRRKLMLRNEKIKCN